jgi:hypothetical protein
MKLPGAFATLVVVGELGTAEEWLAYCRAIRFTKYVAYRFLPNGNSVGIVHEVLPAKFVHRLEPHAGGARGSHSNFENVEELVLEVSQVVSTETVGVVSLLAVEFRRQPSNAFNPLTFRDLTCFIKVPKKSIFHEIEL